jgi:hypothetical protein
MEAWNLLLYPRRKTIPQDGELDKEKATTPFLTSSPYPFPVAIATSILPLPPYDAITSPCGLQSMQRRRRESEIYKGAAGWTNQASR